MAYVYMSQPDAKDAYAVQIIPLWQGRIYLLPHIQQLLAPLDGIHPLLKSQIPGLESQRKYGREKVDFGRK